MIDVVLYYVPVSTCMGGSRLLGENLGDTYVCLHGRYCRAWKEMSKNSDMQKEDKSRE
jgi:hypothetical protein